MVNALNVPMLVISGGEPLLQAEGIRWFLNRLFYGPEKTPVRAIEIETNGTIDPYRASPLVSRFNVSPKLSGSGNSFQKRHNESVLQQFVILANQNRAAFKFVVTNDEDVREVEDLAKELSIPQSALWVMPEGQEHDRLTTNLRWLAPIALERRWNLTSRLHVAIWGAKRGV
jgi:organic radical activating enzyme